MASYSAWFDQLGLRHWCDAGGAADPVSLQDLINLSHGNAAEGPWWDIPFPSLDNLHKACGAIGSTRDMTTGIESGFLAIKDDLKIVLDPLTQPLSWILNGSLHVFGIIPWWVLIPALLLLVWYVSRAVGVTIFVAVSFIFIAFIGYYSYAIETLSIIFVCTLLCIIFGVPIGIVMSKSDAFQRSVIPILDML
jgi:glycine betaine/proline transport system permease protein